jgi:hypothetical protein
MDIYGIVTVLNIPGLGIMIPVLRRNQLCGEENLSNFDIHMNIYVYMYTYICLGSWDNNCIVKFLIDIYMNTYVYI